MYTKETITKIDLTNYNPLPSQQYLHNSKARFKAYIGGFGSGKSLWLIYEALRISLSTPNNYGVLMRRTYNELDDTLLNDFQEIIPEEMISKYNPTKRNYELINGSKIIFRSFDSLGKILSYNIGWFGIDQAEELPEEYFLALVSRGRKKNVNNRHGLLSCNPAGHNWIWRRFIRDNPEKDKPVKTLYDYVVTQSYENYHLPSDYIPGLKEIYPQAWFDRYVLAKFNDFEGLVLDKFNDQKHICQSMPFSLLDTSGMFTASAQEELYFVIGIDPGIDSPCAVLFTFFYPEKRKLVLFDEIYERNLTIKQMAFLIQRRIKKWGIKQVWKYVVDPDALKREKTTGNRAMQDFRLNGIPVVKANNAVDYSIMKLNEMFSMDIIMVLAGLKNFFSEIYDWSWLAPKKTIEEGYNSPGKPQDKNDHLMATLRYVALALPPAWTQENCSEIANIYKDHIAKRFAHKKSKYIGLDRGERRRKILDW